jgi:hypothetical protein
MYLIPSHFCQSDETAVLKHFNWPERKADALREAASEYGHLKCLLTEISSLRDEDDGGSGSEATTTRRKISSLLDKYVWQQQSSLYNFFFNAIATKLKIYMSPILVFRLEKSMGRLVNLRRSAMPSYKELRIPTDWMLDSGMASKVIISLALLTMVSCFQCWIDVD